MDSKIYKTLFFFILFSVSFSYANSQSKHVILVSIDGFRPEMYLDKSLPAPNLQKMASEGAYAKAVRGVFPTVTYPSHTTLVSGALPARHGVYYNSPFEPNGQTGRWYWEYKKIDVPTLWSAIRKSNLKSASLIWPVTLGAPISYNIPEIWSLESEDRITPLRKNAVPDGFFEELEMEATGALNQRTFSGDYLNREDKTGDIGAYILETYKPSFMALHLIGTDHFQHVYGRKHHQVSLSIAAADRAVGKILEAAQRAGIEESTTIIVAGDHGFVDIHTAISPNVWLVDEGLRTADDDRGDWKATFHTSGASAFLHLKQPNDQETLKRVSKLLDNLPKRQKKLFTIIEKEQLTKIGADPNAFLALAPIEGISMSPSAKGDVLKSASGGTHGYFPDFKKIHTGFIAFGSGIRKGAVIPIMGLEDVAPLIAELLKLDFDAPDGVLLPGILKE